MNGSPSPYEITVKEAVGKSTMVEAVQIEIPCVYKYNLAGLARVVNSPTIVKARKMQKKAVKEQGSVCFHCPVVVWDIGISTVYYSRIMENSVDSELTDQMVEGSCLTG